MLSAAMDNALQDIREAVQPWGLTIGHLPTKMARRAITQATQLGPRAWQRAVGTPGQVRGCTQAQPLSRNGLPAVCRVSLGE